MSLGKIEEISKIHGKKNESDREYLRFLKRGLHKRERLRMKRDLEYEPKYSKFDGWDH